MIMNKLLIGAIGAAGMLTTLSACSDTFDPSSTSDREGTLLVSVDVDNEVAAPKALSRAVGQAFAIDASALKLRLTGGNRQVWNWDSPSEMGQGTYPVGHYEFEAYYGDAAEEGFEKPYYYGHSDLTVLENRVTTVAVTAALANAMVTATVSDTAKDFFADMSLTVESSTGATHAYGLDETRALYIAPGATSVNVDVTLQDGTKAKLTPVTFDAKARNAYQVNISVNNGETGKTELNVTFSDALAEETVEIDLSAELLSAPAPEIATSGFTSGEPLTFVVGSTPSTPLKATVTAQAKMGTVVMTTSSASLQRQGWPEVVDFATADAATLAKLSDLGLQFNGLTGQKSRMAQLDFTNVIEHISYNESGNNHTEISIVAKDAVTKESNPVTLSFDIQKTSLEIESFAFSPVNNTITLNVAYNGGNLTEDVASGAVQFLMQNDRGTYDKVTPVSITPAARSTERYIVVLPTPADGDAVVKIAYGNQQETSTVKGERPALDAQLAVNENDVFATHAALSVRGTEVSGAKVMVSTNGGNTYTESTVTPSNGTLTFTGLAPATTYTVRMTANGLYSNKVAFTTEAALQIPNSNMEAAVTNSGTNTKNNIFVSPWGTNNAMTTSQGADVAYCKNSGTIPTTDAHSGSAALIRTVGWGSGNTATGNVNRTKYIDAGLLHLGSSRSTRPSGYSDVSGSLSTEDLDCGYAFESRPSSMKFWYKYTAKNSADHGIAIAYVSDASGNVIASGRQELGSQGSYTEATFAFNYTDGAPKAAKIYVCFMSTNVTTALTKDSNWITPPGFGGIAPNNQFIGSQLYIDDIELTY